MTGQRTEYDPAVQRIVDAINSIDSASVYTVTDHVSRTTIDFQLGTAEGLSAYKAAKGGRFGSSVVVDTQNDEVITATLRLGSLGLPEGGDLFFARIGVEKLLAETRPDLDPEDVGEESQFTVRFRDMSGYKSDTLRSEGDDILHVVLNERMSAGEFATWLPQFVRLYRRRRDEIRQRTEKLGYTDG